MTRSPTADDMGIAYPTSRVEHTITKRQMQAEASRRSLIDYGSEIIKRKGFTEVGIEEITSACGMSKGLFYHYFPSKQDYLGAICAAPFEKLNQELRKDDVTPICELLAWYVDTWITMMYENHLLTSANWVAASAQKSFLESYRKATGSDKNYAQDCIASVDDRIRHAIRRGELEPSMDSLNISRVIVGLLLGTLVTRCLSLDEAPKDDWKTLNMDNLERLLDSHRVPGYTAQGRPENGFDVVSHRAVREHKEEL